MEMRVLKDKEDKYVYIKVYGIDVIFEGWIEIETETNGVVITLRPHSKVFIFN